MTILRVSSTQPNASGKQINFWPKNAIMTIVTVSSTRPNTSGAENSDSLDFVLLLTDGLKAGFLALSVAGVPFLLLAGVPPGAFLLRGWS